MPATPDGGESLTRSRLCELGEIERGRHIRWTRRDGALLRGKERFGELDLVRAVILDELVRQLKLRAAATVWRQVRGDVDHPGQRLEIVVVHATLEARLVRSDAELAAALPRNESLIVIDLEPRARRARERLAAFRGRLGGRAEDRPPSGLGQDAGQAGRP